MKLAEFQTIFSKLGEYEAVILKFGATWCKPCCAIKSFLNGIVKRLPVNVKFYEIDIDESVELYLAFKSKKMIKGVPTMLAFRGDSENDVWYTPDELVRGTDEGAISCFFESVST